MRVTFCGVRGSTPAPGRDFIRYGGHTSCVALAHDGEPPTLLLDAGTGLRRVDDLLGAAPFRGSVLLGHLHWDHTHGLPFWPSGGRPGARVDLFLPDQGADPEQVLERAFSPPHFPVEPRVLGAGWTFTSLPPGPTSLEGFDVLALEIPHKGGRTFGFRVTCGASTIAYVSDHSPVALGPGADGLGALHEAALTLARDADLLVHDAQHTAAEFAPLAYLGHSAAEYALALAQVAGVHRLALFHHDWRRTDEGVDAVLAALPAASTPTFAAAEGDVVDLPCAAGHATFTRTSR